MNRHKADRHKVEWDGLHYVGKCEWCGAGVYRISHKQWRLLGPE